MLDTSSILRPRIRESVQRMHGDRITTQIENGEHRYEQRHGDEAEFKRRDSALIEFFIIAPILQAGFKLYVVRASRVIEVRRAGKLDGCGDDLGAGTDGGGRIALKVKGVCVGEVEHTTTTHGVSAANLR